MNDSNTPILSLQVKGMTCANCAMGIEKYLKKNGHESVLVDFASEEVVFEELDQDQLPEVIAGIERLGYDVITEVGREKEERWSFLEKLFFFCLIWTLPLLLHMFISWQPLHNPYVQLFLTIPVFIAGMYHFGRSAWGSLKTGVPNMDVLITIGASAAFFYSLYGMLMNLGPDFLFYETAASIITLVLLGNVLEHRAVKKTTSAIQDLSELQPSYAKRIPAGGHALDWEEIPVSSVRKDDILWVNMGDQIPVDGVIISGDAEIDESAITGESFPKVVALGDTVIGGTVLVQGSVQMKATAVGKGTMLSRIINLVKKAQADKPPIQQLADKISAIFVPAVLVISLLTFLLSWLVFDLSVQQALIHSVAVLVISCPCAMGLATPTAVIVGIGRASKRGILIKGGRTLEQFSTIKRIVFDKTGTLTTGAFQVAQIHTAEAEIPLVKQVIYSLEQHSSHPIAKSLIREFAGTDVLPLLEVKESKGLGISGTDKAGNQYQLGSYRLVTHLTQDDSHHVYLLRNNELWASIDLEDQLRPDAAEMVSYFKNKGIEPILLSGDRQAACESVATQVGITQIYAEQLPQQKLDLIEKLNEEMPSAMIGDGINDAPALTKASVGVSLGAATEIAIQSSQVLLINNKLSALEELHKISRHTVMTIRQNLLWAFLYNVIAIPFAAFGFLRPILAAGAMAMSDVMVIGNSLRLKIKQLS